MASRSRWRFASGDRPLRSFNTPQWIPGRPRLSFAFCPLEKNKHMFSSEIDSLSNQQGNIKHIILQIEDYDRKPTIFLLVLKRFLLAYLRITGKGTWAHGLPFPGSTSTEPSNVVSVELGPTCQPCLAHPLREGHSFGHPLRNHHLLHGDVRIRRDHRPLAIRQTKAAEIVHSPKRFWI